MVTTKHDQRANLARKKTVAHAIEDINFRDNYLRCRCGTTMRALDDLDLLESTPWREHLNEVRNAQLA